MTQGGKVAANFTIASSVIRLRITTGPATSMPARLQLFLPRSIPNTAMDVFVISPLLSFRHHDSAGA
jgi:hypothetical protein